MPFNTVLIHIQGVWWRRVLTSRPPNGRDSFKKNYIYKSLANYIEGRERTIKSVLIRLLVFIKNEPHNLRGIHCPHIFSPQNNRLLVGESTSKKTKVRSTLGVKISTLCKAMFKILPLPCIFIYKCTCFIRKN